MIREITTRPLQAQFSTWAVRPYRGGDSTYQEYTVDFTAILSNTAITFAFREDPAFIYFSSPSVTDQTIGGGNLLVNSSFSGAAYTSNGNSSTPVGWTYANVYGATFGGVLMPDCGVGPGGSFGVGNCWYDGAVQAYDALTQTLATTPGHRYQIAFWIADDSDCETDGGPPCNFSDLSTNGDTTDTQGNGIDVTVYAAAGLPAPAAIHIELGRDAVVPNQGMLALATAMDINGNPVDMQDAAQKIGFDHFNYLQIILTDAQLQACAANMSLPGCASDATITGKVPTLPSVDPPLGGYAYESSACPGPNCQSSFPTQDFWPMYWDEYLSPVPNTLFYTPDPGAPEYLTQYRQGNRLASEGAISVAPSLSRGFSFSDVPTTNFVVPGTTSQNESINFVTALVGITGTCNQLISTNCAFQIFPGTTFKWTSTNGTVSFTGTPGSTPGGAALLDATFGRARERRPKQADNFPVNPVDLTGTELANSLISVDEFLALANLTPDGLAAMGGGISIFSGSLIPSEATALATAETAVPLNSGSDCNGVFDGTFKGNVTVSAGQTCTFVSGGITGNIIQYGGSLMISDLTVGGNVQVQGGGTFSIGPSAAIGGALQIYSIPAGTAQSQVCGTTVKGSLQFEDNRAAVLIGAAAPISCAGNTIGGDLTIKDNTASISAVGNTVRYNLAVQNNAAATIVDGNTVSGELLDGSNTSTQVFNNTVAQSLQCAKNSSITGGGNTAGRKQGQCVSF
jgi:hypothetical protein